MAIGAYDRAILITSPHTTTHPSEVHPFRERDFYEVRQRPMTRDEWLAKRRAQMGT